MGLRAVAAAQLAFSLMNVVLELLDRSQPEGRKIPILQILAVRMGMTYIGSTLWMLGTGIKHPFFGPPKVRRLLVARGVCGFFALFAPTYYSVGLLTLSDSTALTFLTPFATGFFGHIFLREPFERRETLAAFASLIGVLLVTRPHALFGGDEAFTVQHVARQTGGTGAGGRFVGGSTRAAVFVTCLGVAGAAAAYTVISAIGKRAHAIHTVAYYSSACFISCILEMILFRVRPILPSSLHSLNLLLLAGALGFLAQTLLSVGLQNEKAGRGSLVMYLQIIFGGVVDRLAFSHLGKPLPWLTLLGSTLIVLAATFGTFAVPPPTFLTRHFPFLTQSPPSSKHPFSTRSADKPSHYSSSTSSSSPQTTSSPYLLSQPPTTSSYSNDNSNSDSDSETPILPRYSPRTPTSPKLHHPFPIRLSTSSRPGPPSRNNSLAERLASLGESFGRGGGGGLPEWMGNAVAMARGGTGSSGGGSGKGKVEEKGS